MAEIVLHGPGEYGHRRKAAIEGNFLYGLMRVDDQQVKGGFQPQFEGILFGGFTDKLLEKFLQVKGRVMGDLAECLHGDLLVKMGKDVVDDLVYFELAFGLGSSG